MFRKETIVPQSPNFDFIIFKHLNRKHWMHKSHSTKAAHRAKSNAPISSTKDESDSISNSVKSEMNMAASTSHGKS